MPRRRKNLKYSAEAAKTISLTGGNDKAVTVPKASGRCLLRVSLQDGVIESHITELWERQGCITVDDGAAI